MAYVSVENGEKIRSLLKEIFNDSFMQEYTNFQTFAFFQYSSAVIANWNADPMVYDESLMDYFVRESTCFASWNEMVMKATDLRFKPQTDQISKGADS